MKAKNKINKETETIIKELALYRAGLEGLSRKLTYNEAIDLLNNIFKEIANLLREFGIDWRDYTGEKKKKILKETKEEEKQSVKKKIEK